jgi:hypothetical protein
MCVWLDGDREFEAGLGNGVYAGVCGRWIAAARTLLLLLHSVSGWVGCLYQLLCFILATGYSLLFLRVDFRALRSVMYYLSTPFIPIQLFPYL